VFTIWLPPRSGGRENLLADLDAARRLGWSMAGTFPSRDVWRRPKLRPVDLRRGFTAEEARRQLDTAIE
jgi:hypothetical protein